MQVVAYLEVTPDVMPAKIYVNETATPLQGFMEPFSQIQQQPFTSDCSDLLSRVVATGLICLLYTQCFLSLLSRHVPGKR